MKDLLLIASHEGRYEILPKIEGYAISDNMILQKRMTRW